VVKIPENMQSQFKLAQQEEAQRSGFVELITLWFAYAFVVGCSGLFWGAIIAMGVSPVGLFRPVLALPCLFFVFGGARYLYTKTKTLVLGKHLVRNAA
jgi:hypothetical protein